MRTYDFYSNSFINTQEEILRLSLPKGGWPVRGLHTCLQRQVAPLDTSTIDLLLIKWRLDYFSTTIGENDRDLENKSENDKKWKRCGMLHKVWLSYGRGDYVIKRLCNDD